MRNLAERFIHHPITEMSVVVLIVAWVFALIGEESLQDPATRVVLSHFSIALNLVFVVELSLRFWVAPVKGRFFRDYWLDLVAVLPFELLVTLEQLQHDPGQTLPPLAALRLLRLLRLLRVGTAIRRSAGELAIVAMISLCFVLGAAMFLHEQNIAVGGATDTLAFEGLAGGPRLTDFAWFSVFTFVGGEPIGAEPNSDLGRLVSLALMVGGMTLFGMFIGAVSASMTTAFSRRMEVSAMERIDQMTDHLVICGWNLAGPTMLQELFATRERPRSVVVITEHAEKPDGLDVPGAPSEAIQHIHGDYTKIEVLEQVNIQKCAMAILLTDTLVPRSDQDRDARTVLAALTIERLNPEVFCCAELTSWEHAELLRRSGVEEIVVRDWYAGVILGSMSRNWGLAAVLRDILSTSDGNAFNKVDVRASSAGKTIGTLHSELKMSRGLILVALEHDGSDGQRAITVNPPAEQVVARGDVLVVIGPHGHR